MERTENQDYYGYYEPESDQEFERFGRLVVVCDGMGGHAGGERASRLAVETIVGTYRADPSEDRAQALRVAIEKANRAIWDEASANPELKGMGSTALAMVMRQGFAIIGHVGDSRCYLIRQGQLHHMTKDHSLVQQMVDEGLIRPEDMENHPDKNVILRSMGVKPDVEVDISQGPYQPGDIYVLSSDGLTGLVSDEEIRQISLHMQHRPMDACARMVELTNQYGGYDNVTVQMVHVLSLNPNEPVQVAEAGPSADEIQRSIEEARQAMAGKTMPSEAEMAGREGGGSGEQRNITATISKEEVEAAKREAQKRAEEQKAAKAATSGGGGGGGKGPMLAVGVGVAALIIGLLLSMMLSSGASEAYARLSVQLDKAKTHADRGNAPTELKDAIEQAESAVEKYRGLLGGFTSKGDLNSAADKLEALNRKLGASSQASDADYKEVHGAAIALRERGRAVGAERHAAQRWREGEEHLNTAEALAGGKNWAAAIDKAQLAIQAFAVAALDGGVARATQELGKRKAEVEALISRAKEARAEQHVPELYTPATEQLREAERLAGSDPAEALRRLDFAAMLLQSAVQVAPSLEKKN
jgi:protein phosphatase